MADAKSQELFKEAALSHQQMAVSFPAYRDMVAHFDKMIADMNDGWEDLSKDQFDFARGKKAGMVEFRKYLRSFLEAKFDVT